MAIVTLLWCIPGAVVALLAAADARRVVALHERRRRLNNLALRHYARLTGPLHATDNRPPPTSIPGSGQRMFM